MSQPRNRGSNYLQSLGQDPDKKTPGHDWILLEWLNKQRLIEIASRSFPIHDWDPSEVERLRAYATNSVAHKLAESERQRSDEQERLDRLLKEGRASASVERLLNDIPALEKRIVRLRSWQGLGEPPLPNLTITSVKDAHPVYDEGRSLRPAIYIDRLVSFERSVELQVQEDDTVPVWAAYFDRPEIAFEIKSRITSYSELIQQLTTYRGFLSRKIMIVVVCPNDQFKSAIEDQGFSFLKCDEPPKKPTAQSQLF